MTFIKFQINSLIIMIKKNLFLILPSMLLGMAMPADAASYAVNFLEASGDGAINVTTDQYGVSVGEWTNVAGNTGGPSALLGLTGATVSWNSANTWRNTGGPTEASKGYLDDGNLSITLSGVLAALQTISPSTTGYTLQLLYSSGDATRFLPASLDGIAGVFTAGPGDANNVSRTELSGLSPVQTAASSLINGAARSGTERGSIAAVIINPVPEPSASLLGLAALTGLACRRKR